MKKYYLQNVLVTSLIILLFGCKSDEGYIVEPEVSAEIETVIIPAGTFEMGNSGTFSGNANELPVHSVTLTKSILMGKYEVTQIQWNKLMDYNPSTFIDDLSLPVEYISWEEALIFCNKLSEFDGFQKCYTFNEEIVEWNKKADGWRLPTEAEWEYACKAGSTSDYYTGQMLNDSGYLTEENLDDTGWYYQNSDDVTHPVGLKSPNKFGLYDMIGNVFEWCWDVKADYKEGSVMDPSGPLQNSLFDDHITRGGSWDSYSDVCRSSNRQLNSKLSPGLCFVSFGFRVVRNI